MFLSGLPGYSPEGGGTRGQPTLTLPELDSLLREFLLGTYHLREHSQTKRAPQERWEQGGFLPRMPESLEQLDLLLLTVPRARKVHPDGIRFQGLRYVDTTLAAYIGEPVTLRYDPRDMAEIRVFHDERFLCRAICPELAGQAIPLRDVLRARSQHRREVRALLRDRKKTVDALLEIKGGSGQDSSASVPREETPQRQEEQATPSLRRYVNE